jgi:hypothetical protein
VCLADPFPVGGESPPLRSALPKQARDRPRPEEEANKSSGRLYATDATAATSTRHTAIMHDDLSAPAPPATGSEISSPFGAVARLLGLSEPGLGFSVPPRHRGGIEARSGLAFQDEDALRQIGRLLRQDGQRALSVRLEGAGDTDVLALRQGGGVVEEYRQVKGRREGLAKWSLVELGREGVWSEFIRTTTAFVQRAGADRSLLLVFVTDGELDTALQALRDDPAAFRNGSGATSAGRDVTRGALLMNCALGLLSPSVAARIQTAAGRDRLRQLCEDVARVLDHAWLRRDGVADAAAEWPAEAADAVASLAARLDGENGSLLSAALQDAARRLDLLLESLRFESRVRRSGAGAGDDDVPAEQAEMVLVLIEAGRLDAAAAREALRKLRVAVADRALVGATLDEGAVRRITDLPAPLQLEPFPHPVGARIRRVETEPAILRGLRTHRAVWVYGPPRVGKTEAVRAALERGRLQERTVWLRLAGDGADIDRIWLHLAFWIGERTGNRELYRALRSGGVHAVEVRGQIARAGGELQAVLVADDVSRVPEAGHGALLASLEEVRLGGVGVVALAEDRPTVPATGFRASAEPVAIEGFTTAEALQFWRALGKVPSNDAAMMAAMKIVHRTAGHPEILRLIAGGLPDAPSAAELDAVCDALPAGEGAGLLRDLAWKLFRADPADDFQRGLIPRVALATHELTEAQARAIAAVHPPLRWSAFGWLDLSTTLLEEVRRGRYRLPPIYQAVARMEVAGDDALERAVHRACAETVLDRFSRERTIDWPDLYQVTLDYVFALEWKQAALNALWLANSALSIPAAQERLQLALLPFRGPAAMTCGLEPDLHVAVLGASVMAERRMGDAAGTRDALEAMRRVAAAASGEAGYRARTVAALFTAVDASLGGDHDAAFAAVDPAWREAAEHGDALQLRLLGDIRLSAAALGATGAGVVLEQIEALEHAGEAIASLGDLGLNESTPGLVPVIFSRVSRAVQDDTRPALIEAYERYLGAFRARGVPEGIAAVAPSLCALLYDGSRKDDAVALASQVARELAETPFEGEGILLLADFHRLREQWAPAVDAYGQAIPLLRAAGSQWLRAAHTGAALALHHHGDQRLAACHAFAAYRLFAADEDANPRLLYEALGRAAVLAYRAGRYRLSAACLPRLLRLAEEAGDAKRKRLVAMLARQIAESIGAPEPRFGAAPGAFPAPAADLPPPSAATALGVYFFEQDLGAVGLLGEPGDVSNLAHHLVFNTLTFVGLTRQAVRAGKKAVAEWLRAGDAAGAMTSFDLLRHVDDRAGDVEGALARIWEVLPPATALAEQEGKDRAYAEQVVLDYWTPAPLSRLAGLARDEAERLLDAFAARFDTLSPEARKEWTAEAEIARARLALAKGDRGAADRALMAASGSADGTRIAGRVRIHAARLRAFGNGAGYARDVLEALRLQAEYAERLAAAGATAENERAELGRRLLSFWTETVNSVEPPFDRLAELFAREGGGGAGFRSAAANVLTALGLIDAPIHVGAGLAGRLLDGGGAELDDAQLEEVLRRYLGAGLERAVAAGMMGNPGISRQEFESIAEKLRTHQSTFEPALRRLLAPEVVGLLLGFSDGTDPTAA